VFLMLPFTYMAKADNTPYYINRIPTCVHVIYICCDATGVRQLPVDSETRYREWRARKEWFSHPLTPLPSLFHSLGFLSGTLARCVTLSVFVCYVYERIHERTRAPTRARSRCGTNPRCDYPRLWMRFEGYSNGILAPPRLNTS